MDNKENANSIYRICAAGLIWIVIWFLAAFAIGSDLILPGPVRTVQALAGLIATGAFWIDVLWTLFRVILGMVISFAAGSVCAALACRNKAFRDFLRLPVSFFKSIPVMAIIIYVILVIKADWVAVVVCFLMCFPIAYTNMLSGLMSMRKEFDELGTVLGMSGKQRKSIIERPELQPQIRASVNLIAGMSWKVVVASEVLAIPEHSIGYQMLNAKYYLETPDLFAYIIVLIILSLAVEKAASYIAGLGYRNVGKRVRDEVKTAGDMSGTGPVTVKLTGVSKSFVSEDGTTKKVLNDANMEFTQGVTALLGPSGEGKTTIARLILGLEKPDAGEVAIIPEARPDVLFQEDRLFPWLTVEENMLLAYIDEGTSDPAGSVREMAEKLEIDDSLSKKPDELSGGMAHRAALGRALLGSGRLLILDEPMRGLDQELVERLIQRIDDPLRHDPYGNGRTVVLITHDEELAKRIADREVRL